MNTVFTFGAWRAELRTRELSSSDGTFRLERRAIGVLAELARAAPDAVTSEELVQRVWQGVVVGDGALYRVIALLRKVLHDDPREPSYIESIPRLGYRLLVPVHFEPAPPDNGYVQRAALVRDARSPALDRYSLFTEDLADGVRPIYRELAGSVGKHVGWSSRAFKVIRNPETPSERYYVLRLDVVEERRQTRVSWSLHRGVHQELVWASGHCEGANSFAPKLERIAELVADGIVKGVRRCRLAAWDRDPQSEMLTYWDLVTLADHYRSMEPKEVEARRRMLRRAMNSHPDLAPAHAAYADFLSWEIANGICANPRRVLDEVRLEANTAIDLDSSDPYVLSRCGAAFGRAGAHQSGVELCRRAHALAPCTATKEPLATALCFAGQPDEAIALYRELEDTMPAGQVFQYGKIVVPLVQAGRLTEALEYSELAAIHFPKDYFCWCLRSNLLAHADRLAEAESAFAQARALMPTVTLASAIDGTRRTYGRTLDQQRWLTAGLARLSER